MDKKFFHIIFFISLGVALGFSCNDSEKSKDLEIDEYDADYGELVEKYMPMTFSNCDEAIAAGNDIAYVFYHTADKAFNENDAKAKSDLELFDDLFIAFDSVVDAMFSTCPEKFDKWAKDNKEKIESIKDRISMKADNDTIIWNEDVSEEIESVNEQTEKLKQDILKFTEEDDSIKK